MRHYVIIVVKNLNLMVISCIVYCGVKTAEFYKYHVRNSIGLLPILNLEDKRNRFFYRFTKFYIKLAK